MQLRTVAGVLGVLFLIALGLAVWLLAWALRQLREKRIRVAPGADFFTTLRAVPLALVVGIDLLDFGLEIFSTPIIWFILNRLKLQKLRDVATIEALIPISGPIPTLTIAWLLARFFKLGQPYDPNVIETERVGPNTYVARPVPPRPPAD